jgi:signal transduction histidine kinase
LENRQHEIIKKESMTTITVPPDVARITEGLRDTGYDFNTAVADIIDNSIAAHATKVDVRLGVDFGGNILLSVGDNGDRSGSAYLNRFTPRDKDTAGGLN